MNNPFFKMLVQATLVPFALNLLDVLSTWANKRLKSYLE